MKQWANRKCDVKKRNSHRHFSKRFCKNGVRWRNKEVTSTVATVLSLFNQKGTYLVIVTKYNRAPFLHQEQDHETFQSIHLFSVIPLRITDYNFSLKSYTLQRNCLTLHCLNTLMLKESLLGESDSAGIQRGTFSCKSKSIKASYTMEYSRDFT